MVFVHRLLLLYGEFCVVTIMLWPSTETSTHALHQALNGIVFEVLFVLAAAAHARTMLTNPGTVPKGNATDDNIQRMALAPGQVCFFFRCTGAFTNWHWPFMFCSDVGSIFWITRYCNRMLAKPDF
jgi:hypothetical protein